MKFTMILMLASISMISSSAVRVTDIFDAYDEESKKEAVNQGKDETIDAV